MHGKERSLGKGEVGAWRGQRKKKGLILALEGCLIGGSDFAGS